MTAVTGAALTGLVLPGGGSRGSWQAGVLLYMGETNRLPTGANVVTCTSVGGINGTGIGMFPPEQFGEAARFVEHLWRTRVRHTSDIWRLRFPMGLPGLWHPSIGLNDALAALLEDVVDLDAVATSGVELRYTAVDLETGTLKLYDQHALAEHGLKPVLATSSFPDAFPPVEIGKRYETDGGVVEIAPLSAALKAGCTAVTVLPTHDPDQLEFVPRETFQTFPGALAVARRVISIQSHDVLRNDLRMCRQVNDWLDKGWLDPACGQRHVDLDVIAPSKQLGNSLDFSGELMDRQLDQGYEDARRYYER